MASKTATYIVEHDDSVGAETFSNNHDSSVVSHMLKILYL